VKNGRVKLRAIEFDKFNVLISSEHNARVREPRRPHHPARSVAEHAAFPPDLLEFSLGAAGSRGAMDHGAHESSGWPMVPTPPGLTMLPSEMALRPAVTPFLPAADEPLPNAESHEVIRARTAR